MRLNVVLVSDQLPKSLSDLLEDEKRYKVGTAVVLCRFRYIKYIFRLLICLIGDGASLSEAFPSVQIKSLLELTYVAREWEFSPLINRNGKAEHLLRPGFSSITSLEDMCAAVLGMNLGKSEQSTTTSDWTKEPLDDIQIKCEWPLI